MNLKQEQQQKNPLFKAIPMIKKKKKNFHDTAKRFEDL